MISEPGLEVAEIRRAALRLFAERGYRATTMADVGAAVGVRGPSLYRHVKSKQDLLAAVMVETMEALLDAQRAAAGAGGDPVLRLRRMVEAHVRYHAGHRDQAFVGNREIGNLDQPARDQILAMRATYERTLRGVIEEGCDAGVFAVEHPRLASYSILDMGIGVAAWFRPDGPHSVEQVAYTYADQAIRMLSAARPES
ncbi:TetR/AcrR family transcriptional regulator [Dactylosporangium sp. NPDC000521]|uniref:TetR/AcrR family transcriptional regulator n=1 Tax=Dactylosporangium sp. NPDC000521 TaxID=3363975 RepID=UPI00369E2A78